MERRSSPRRSRTAPSFADVEKAAGHRDAGTKKLYDRRGYIPRRRLRSSPRTNDQRFMPTPQRHPVISARLATTMIAMMTAPALVTGTSANTPQSKGWRALSARPCRR